jgi:hypothetical protein
MPSSCVALHSYRHRHLVGVGQALEVPHATRVVQHASAQLQYQVQIGVGWDVVILQRAVALKLFASKNQALLLRRSAFKRS